MLNKPLNPSIRLEPLIINKKHKQINIKAKISIAIRLSKNSKPVLFILNVVRCNQRH